MWRAVLDEMAHVMTSENFNAWFATTHALDQEGELLRVAVPTQFNKEWLEGKLRGRVMGTLHKVDGDVRGAGHVERVEYIVDPVACASTGAAARTS